MWWLRTKLAEPANRWFFYGEKDIINNMIKPQTLKGFRDFLPGEMRKRQYVIDILKSVFESYGFEPLETPALEYEEILLGKYGEEGDKLMYRFKDLGGRKVALRYDQTVPLARVISQYQDKLPLPFKRYQIQPVWRAENPQRGRFREFLQCDIDIVGSNSPYVDAEIIACISKCLDQLGFKTYKILINDRAIFNENYIKTSFDIPINAVPLVFRAIDKIKKIGKDRVQEEFIKSGFTKEQAEEILQKVDEAKPSPALEENIFTALKDLGVSQDKFKFEPTLVRGLDYYTEMVFEVEVEGIDLSIVGGGRYDNLIGIFAGKAIPAVGGSFGFDRLIEAMDQLGLFPADLSTTKALITIFSQELADKSTEIVKRLREENINVELWLDPQVKLEKQLKYADQKGIPYVVIIGPEEASKNEVTIKILKTGEQKSVPVEKIKEVTK